MKIKFLLLFIFAFFRGRNICFLINTTETVNRNRVPWLGEVVSHSPRDKAIMKIKFLLQFFWFSQITLTSPIEVCESPENELAYFNQCNRWALKVTSAMKGCCFPAMFCRSVTVYPAQIRTRDNI